jgi:hypothetical protein
LRLRLDRGLVKRLARVAAVVERWTAARENARRTVDTRRLMAEAIRAGLAYNGIDPATVPAMQRLDALEDEPPPIFSVRRASPLDAFRARMTALARHLRAHPPPLEEMTPIRLFALFYFDDDPAPAPG